MRRRRAFSLVELLIVVSIIVILIAMMGLAYGRFREFTTCTACASNLKTIQQALIQYTFANSGRFPDTHPGGATYFRHPYIYDDGYKPDSTPWVALSDVKQLKDQGFTVEVAFCPTDPRSKLDHSEWPLSTWDEPYTRSGAWTEKDGSGAHHGMTAYVYFGYVLFTNFGWAPMLVTHGAFSDGRPAPMVSSDDPNLPIAADILYYRGGNATGWYHGGGLDPGADVPDAGEGLFNSGCNTVYVGGHVIWKEWEDLDEQGPAQRTFYWFCLGNDLAED